MARTERVGVAARRGLARDVNDRKGFEEMAVRKRQIHFWLRSKTETRRDGGREPSTFRRAKGPLLQSLVWGCELA